MRRHNKELYDEIARLTCEYRKLDEVECIYLMPHTMDKKDIYSLILVLSEPIKDKNVLYRMSVYNVNNRSASRKVKFGGEVRVGCDFSKYYNEKALTQKEIDKAVALKSSHILYDKTGDYIKIRKGIEYDKYINSFKLPKARKLQRELNKNE